MRQRGLSCASSVDADHPRGRLADRLRAIYDHAARIGPLVADHVRFDLLLPASPTTDGTQTWQGERHIIAA